MVAVANPDELEANARQLRTEANALDKAVDPLARSAQGRDMARASGAAIPVGCWGDAEVRDVGGE